MDTILQAEEREKCQDMAEVLSTQNKHLLLQWATGVGKGRAVMKCIAASSSTKPWLVVVPEILQVENYKRDMVKHGFDWMLGSKIVDVICYASLALWEHKEVNLALNEVHRLSDLRTELVKSIKYDQIISDSATIPNAIAEKLADIHPYYNYEITLTEAINRGILPEPAVYVHRIKLDDKLKRNPIKVGKYSRLLTDYEYSKRMDANIKFWQNKAEQEDYPMWISNKIVQLGGERKKFLAKAKNEYAKDFLCTLRGIKSPY
jgi:superfamily II DNA or RNA helicase